jgi:hypothetical protein
MTRPTTSRMIFAHRVFGVILAVGLIACCLSLSGPARAAAPKCNTDAGTAQSLKLSSLKTGDTVTVCASWLVTSQTTSVGPPAQSSGSASGRVSSARKPTKITVPQRRFFSATPDRPTIKSNVYRSIKPGAQVLLASTATRHQHLALLLGKPTMLRFTPVAYRWTTGDASVSTRSQVRHRYKNPGRYTVRMSVTYKSEVRVLPSGRWLTIPFQVTRVAPSVEIVVTNEMPNLGGVAVLVGKTCLEHPSAVGC